MSYAGGVSGNSIIVVGGEVDLGRTTAAVGRQSDDAVDVETKDAGRGDCRVEGELYDEETERWYSLPHIKSGLGPGRTHAATTSCRMLTFETEDGAVSDGSSNSTPSATAVGTLATGVSGDRAGLTLERAGGTVRRGGLVTSMTESTDQVRYGRKRLLLDSGLLNDAILRPHFRSTILGATPIPARHRVVENRTSCGVIP